MKKYTKEQIRLYLAKHPSWVLQQCAGIRSHWWWLRDSQKGQETIQCHAGGARSVAANMKLIHSDWRESTYQGWKSDPVAGNPR